MRCSEIKDLLDLYVDGDLPEEGCARVERHLLRCAACAFEVRSLEQTRAHLRDACPPEEASPSFRERMAARLEDALADVLRAPEDETARQRALPF
jgi:anti-sigma factor RsiW